MTAVLRSVLVVVLLATATLTGAVAPSSAQVAGEDCGDQQVVGDRTSVLLVHGFISSASAWSPPTRQYLATGGGTCVSTFDYRSDSTRWVSDRALGPDLARAVVRLGKASAEGGGTGRVVVVAHSLGGLVLRCATDPACSGGVTDVADHLRAVVTFGTPHLGSHLRSPQANLLRTVWCLAPRLTPAEVAACGLLDWLAETPAGRAFLPGSPELRDLPALPEDVPVLALAGSLELTTTWWGRPSKSLGSAGDLVVGEASALAVHQDRGGIGGERVEQCGRIELSLEVVAQLPGVGSGYRTCHHLDMTDDEAFLADALGVITRVKEQDARSGPVTRQRMEQLALPAGHWCGYASEEFAGGVQLRGGRVVDSRDSGFIETEELLLADLDGDAVTDGVAHLICSSGAGGTTSALEVLLGGTGRVVEVPYGEDAGRQLPDLDVYRLYDIEVTGAELRLRASGHRSDDPVCCPSDEVDVVYRLGRGGPQFVSATLHGPGG